MEQMISLILCRLPTVCINIYKIVISVRLLNVQSKLGNPWTDYPQILIGELGRTTGMLVNNSILSGLPFKGKIQAKSGSQASIQIVTIAKCKRGIF